MACACLSLVFSVCAIVCHEEEEFGEEFPALFPVNLEKKWPFDIVFYVASRKKQVVLSYS